MKNNSRIGLIVSILYFLQFSIHSTVEVKHSVRSEIIRISNFMRFYNELLCDCLDFTENDIDNKIKEIRTYAALNFIDDRFFLEDIKESLQSVSDFHKNRLHEHQDMNSLYKGLKKCGISIVGLFISYLIFKNERNLTRKFKISRDFIEALSFLTTGLSLFPAAFSCLNFYHWRNPRHQEKYKALSLIISRIENALVTETVVEKK